MKKRIKKHTGEFAVLFFALLFLCGSRGNCRRIFGADVEKIKLCDGTEGTELCSGEKYLQEGLETDGQQGEKDGEYTSETPEEEIQNSFTLSVNGDHVLKAGEAAVYEVTLKNTGEENLSDIVLTADFSCPRVTWSWQEAPGLELQEEKSVLSVLEPGQEALLFLTAQLLPEQKESLACTVTASMENGLYREAVWTSETEPLRADFSVEKIADRSVAVAGEEISYQIRIQNTGELTLHSIITTERFLKEGIRAEFVEKEGVELNQAKDKAFISVLNPGECIALKAIVKLPDKGVEGELLNEVVVLTKETGEHEVTAQASVQALKIQDTPTSVPVSMQTESSAPEIRYEGKEIPKTEDGSKPEKMYSLLAASAILCILLVPVLKGKRKH